LSDAAEPLQRAQRVAALSVGTEIIQLRARLDLCGDLALAAVAQGNSAAATVRLAQVDQALAFRASIGAQTQAVLRARSRILALSETLTEYASYFDGGARTFPLTKQGPSFPRKR
jgi:hypothetical protein